MTRDELAGLVRLRDACPKALQSDGNGTLRDGDGRVRVALTDYGTSLDAADKAVVDLAALAPGLVDRLAAFYEIVAAVGAAWSTTEKSAYVVEGVEHQIGERAYKLTAGGGMIAPCTATIGGKKEVADAGVDGSAQEDEGVVG